MATVFSENGSTKYREKLEIFKSPITDQSAYWELYENFVNYGQAQF